MRFRTDLAREKTEINNVGAEEESFISYGINGYHVRLNEYNSELDKDKGNYVSFETDVVLNRNVEEYENVSRAIAQKLSELLGEVKNKTVLVAGLGNGMMTPDSIGPKTIDNIFVTRHIFEFMPEIKDERMTSVCAFKPGVLGVTGLESTDVIFSVCKNNSIDTVIVIDALAARRRERMFSTFQLTDTGIEPGAGVGNKRRGLTNETLGIPVIAIGIPTVVYASSLIYDALEGTGREIGIKDDMIVTPKEIDVVASDSARIIADGINLALHRGMELDEIKAYMF